MSEIRRYGFNTSGRLIMAKDGPYCEYLDVEFARAADKAEIERLTNICKLRERHYESTISVAEARIAELEASLRADRRDAERLRQFEWWANYGLCPHLIFNDNGWWAVSFDGGGDISLEEPPPAGAFTASVEAGQWRETVGEAIDAAIAAAKPNFQGERRTE